MAASKNIKFPKDLKMSFGNFKKAFAGHLVGLNENEVKEYYQTATNSKSNGKFSGNTKKSTESNSPES